MADAYRDLIAWRKATDLALEIYRATQRFPKDELYGLTSQMRRAAVSVASNIAEGKGRYSRKEQNERAGTNPEWPKNSVLEGINVES
jgi:hypothetical protein